MRGAVSAIRSSEIGRPAIARMSPSSLRAPLGSRRAGDRDAG